MTQLLIIQSAQNSNCKWNLHSVYSSTVYNSQEMVTDLSPLPPQNRWLDQEDMVDMHRMEYYWAIKKDKIMPFVATWVELEGIILNEVSQKKDKYHGVTYM